MDMVACTIYTRIYHYTHMYHWVVGASWQALLFKLLDTYTHALRFYYDEYHNMYYRPYLHCSSRATRQKSSSHESLESSSRPAGKGQKPTTIVSASLPRGIPQFAEAEPQSPVEASHQPPTEYSALLVDIRRGLKLKHVPVPKDPMAWYTLTPLLLGALAFMR